MKEAGIEKQEMQEDTTTLFNLQNMVNSLKSCIASFEAIVEKSLFQKEKVKI